MRKIEITLNNITYKASIPTDYEEMTADEIGHILAIAAQETNFQLKKILIFEAISKLPKEIFEEYRSIRFEQGYDYDEFYSEVNEYLKLIDWIFEGNNISPLTYNPLQGFYLNPNTFLICAQSTKERPFTYCTFEEVTLIFHWFKAYQITQDLNELAKICAIIYRPIRADAKLHDDERTPLTTEKDVIERANKILEILPRTLFYVVEAFTATTIKNFIDLHPEVFKGEKSTQGETADFFDFVLELANFDPIQADLIGQKNANEIFSIASKLNKKAKKAKKND